MRLYDAAVTPRTARQQMPRIYADMFFDAADAALRAIRYAMSGYCRT